MMVDHADQPLCSNDRAGGAGRIALAHDWIVARRGGELVLDAIADALLSRANPCEITRLYTMFHAGVPISERIDALPVTVSPLGRLPAPLRRWLLPAYPAAARSLTRVLARDHSESPIDLLVSTSSVAAKAIRPPAGVPHLCYCHTPARYLWSQGDQYGGGGVKGLARGAGLALFRGRLRRWDRDTSAHVSVFVANSSHTREQIRLAYDRDALVIHPPVRTDFFTPDPGVPRCGSLLVVSALEPYKRVDLAIDAAACAGRPLTIIGAGSHERALRAHAARTANAEVTFVGRADDDAVRDAMRRAWAFLMPQTEDFGITCVEAQACGTPVVARGAGGALDTVIDGQTGTLIGSEDAGDWADAIRAINPPDLAISCRANAERFGAERFGSAISALVDACSNREVGG